MKWVLGGFVGSNWLLWLSPSQATESEQAAMCTDQAKRLGATLCSEPLCLPICLNVLCERERACEKKKGPKNIFLLFN